MTAHDPPVARPALRGGALAVLLLIGAVGGTLSGLFGVGGGIIMVPLLMIWAGRDQRQASTASLVAILPTSVAGASGYLAGGHVAVLPAAVIAVGAIAGTLIGSWLLSRIHLTALEWMFIGLLVITAVRMAVFGSNETGDAPEGWLVQVGYLALGLLMGVASGLFGIGGGAIAVPALVGAFGFADLLAKGTSLLTMIPTSVVGTVSNVRRGMVNVRDGLVVGLAATAFSFLGVALAFLIPARLSGLLFGLFLLGTALQLAIKAIRKARVRPDIAPVES